MNAIVQIEAINIISMNRQIIIIGEAKIDIKIKINIEILTIKPNEQNKNAITWGVTKGIEYGNVQKNIGNEIIPRITSINSIK